MTTANIKRILAFVLAFVMVFALCACGAETDTKKRKNKNNKLSDGNIKENVYSEYITGTDTSGEVIEIITGDNESEEQRREAYNVLVLGHERAAMLTDVMMLVNVDPVDNTVAVMQIPRDTYIANHDGLYIPTNKANALFSTYYLDNYRSGANSDKSYNMALTEVADDLERALAVDIDFSIIMDLDGFRNIVDAIGGVEMNVEKPMSYTDPEGEIYIDIPAGYQTLNGEQTEGFVRYRSGYNTADFGRQNAQKLFLAALLKKVKSSISISNVSMLNEVANIINDNICTDMSVADMLYFSKEILGCDLDNMYMFTLPGNLSSSYYVMNRAAAKSVISKYYYTNEGEISDAMFDADGIFNSLENVNINSAYNKPASEVYNRTIYNAENTDEIKVN